MSRWYRHYAGLCRDDKLVGVAIKSKQTIERVVWVWCAILESAAEIDNEGQYRLDTAEIAYFLRADEADICAVENSLADAGRVFSGSVVTWSKRQFASDRSRERVAAHRERKRGEDIGNNTSQQSRNSVVTLQKRYGNSPELKTDTDTEKKEDTASAASSLPAPPVQNLDLIETECRKAAGLETHPSPGLMVIGPIAKLIDAGASLERDILPTLRAWAARKQRPPSSWRYFEGMIADAMRPADPSHFSRGQPPPSPVIADMVFLDRDNPAWHEAMQRVHEKTGKKLWVI